MHIQTWAKSLKGTDLLLFVVASITAVVLGGMTAGIGKGRGGGGAGEGVIRASHRQATTASLSITSSVPVPSTAPTSPLLQSLVPMPLMAATTPPPPVPSAPVVSQPPALSNAIVISACNGQIGSANLRRFPGSTAAVLGVVGNGEAVELTGQRTGADGEVWYEAIAPSLSGQAGWIAGCFVGG